MNSSREVDVVVIGGGVSGLSSAYQLCKLTNYNVKLVVLEAKDRLGGRTYRKSIPSKNGVDDWDMGGQWVSSSQKHVMQLLDEVGLETFPQFTQGSNKLIVNNLSDIRSYSGLIPSLGVLELLDLSHCLNKIESMVLEIDVDEPLKCKNARKWDGVTLQTFAESDCKFSVNINMIASMSRVVFGVEPSQMSLFYFLYYSALAGGLNNLLDTKEGTAQQYRVKGTLSQLADKLQEKIGQDNIICGDSVISIDQVSNSLVSIRTEKGFSYEAKYVISAIPPHLVNQIHFKPSLPINRMQLGARMPVGNLIKFIATYQTTFWRTNGISAESMMITDALSCGPLTNTFDATTHDGSPAIVGFIGGQHALYWTQKTKEERKQAVVECLVGMFGDEAETSLIYYEDKDWSQEQYVGGCPVSVMQPGCLIYFQHALKEPFSRVHWAGTETAQRWTGYVDGAVESGFRAANEVTERIRNDVDGTRSKLDFPSPIFTDHSLTCNNQKLRKNYYYKKLLLFGAFCGVGTACYMYMTRKQ